MQEDTTFALSKIRWKGAIPWLIVWLGMVALGFGMVFWMFGSPAPALVESTVGARGPIVLDFTKAVDEVSFASQVEIQPAVAGEWQMQGNRAVFWPEHVLDPNSSYQIRLNPGVIDEDGRKWLREAVVWRVSIRPLRVVFLGAPSREPEVWTVNTDGSEPQVLTETGGTVYDFAVSPDGGQIAYSAENSTGGYNLWVVDRDGHNTRQVVDCGPNWCVQPNWSRHGQLAYVQKQPESSAGWESAKIWLLDTISGQRETLFAEEELPGFQPSWSPDGRRIAFYDPGARGVRVLDLTTGENLLLPTEHESSGSWSPDGTRLNFLETDHTTFRPFTLAFAADFASGETYRLLSEADHRYEYGLPIVAPSGDRLLLGTRPEEGQPGTQLWTLSPDGTDVRAITDNVTFTHAHYHWSPVGDEVLYQRLLLGTSNSTPEIMLWREATGESVRLAEDASQPDWLP